MSEDILILSCFLLSVNIYFYFFRNSRHLSLNSLIVPIEPLREFMENMPQMTTLSQSGVLNNKHYGDVITAIAENMPNLASLDISQSSIKPSSIERLLPTKLYPQRGCQKLIHLNMKNCKYVTVELLRTILVCLPNLEVLNNALMIEALVDLAKNTENPGQS